MIRLKVHKDNINKDFLFVNDLFYPDAHIRARCRSEEETYALFISDIHYGYPTANIEKAKAMLDYALDNGIYVLLGGDLLEAGLISEEAALQNIPREFEA